MALPERDGEFAAAASLPMRVMLAQWLVNASYKGSPSDYATLPEQYLYAKIAVASGAPRSEYDYISLPKNYVWKAIYDAVTGTSDGLIEWGEKLALGHIAAAYRGDAGSPELLATYINWPWRYQVASNIISSQPSSETLDYMAASGAIDLEGLDRFIKGMKNMGLWDKLICWPLRAKQNAGAGTTAYSLGGVGAYNGTTSGSPTWEDGGLKFTSGIQYIGLPTVSAASIIAGNGGYTSFTALDFVSRATASSNFVQHLSSKIGGGQLYSDAGREELRAATSSDTGERYATLSFAAGTFMGGGPKTALGVLRNDGTGFSVVNTDPANTTVGTFGSAPVPPPYVDGTAGRLMELIGSVWDGNVILAMQAFLLCSLTPEKAVELRTLYKTTLGKGLGL